MMSYRPVTSLLAALSVATALAGCATSNSGAGGSPSGLAGTSQAAVPAPIPPAAMAEPPPEVPPGPPSKSYAYRGGRDPITGQAAVTEGAPEPLAVDANGDIVPANGKSGAKHAAARPAAGGKVAVGAGGSIVVQKGDSLYRIAQRHRVTVSALMSANGLSSPNIVPGQRLVLPR